MPPAPIMLTQQQEADFKASCQQHLVTDVPGRLHALPEQGERLEILTGDEFPEWCAYTQARDNAAGNENHFQGCQRLPGDGFAVSGGDWLRGSSHLFVGTLASRAGRQVWGSNIGRKGPPTGDHMLARLDLDATMWHAGGVSSLGSVVAVPIEGGDVAFKGIRGVKPPVSDPPRSKIFLVDVRTPASPQVIGQPIERPGRKATAAALTWDPAGGYVLAALRAVTKAEQAAGQPKAQYQDRRIEIYRSQGDAICGTFDEYRSFMVPKDLHWGDYQTINFIREPAGSGSPDGRLYLCGMAGDTVDLFEMTIPRVRDDEPSLRFLTSRAFSLDRRYAEFKAGVGIYTIGGTLALYAVPQWRRVDGRLGLTEWAS